MDVVTEVQDAPTAPAAEAAAAEVAEVPTYKAGEVPEPLATMTQLKEQRLKPAEGQEVKGFLRMYQRGAGWGEFPLYDPAGAQPMRPLSAKQQAAKDARRTCPECQTVRGYVVHVRCTDCHTAKVAAEQELATRTCDRCRRVSGAVLGRDAWKWRACDPCRVLYAIRYQAEEERRAYFDRTCRGCPSRACTTELYTNAEVAAARSDGTWASKPRRCAGCGAQWEVDQAERERAQREAAEEAERARVQRHRDLEAWARAALDDDQVVILDTETTGLDDDARIVDIAVIDIRGVVLLDMLVNPGVAIPPDASDIHGITEADVAGAPSFPGILPRLEQVLDGRRCLIYNAPYDTARLRHELTLHHRAAGHPEPEKAAGEWMGARTFGDVMIPYSDWVGDWSDYWGDNTWQPLYGGDHRALGDCRAVIGVLREMAAGGEQQDEDPWSTTAAAPSGGPWGGASSGSVAALPGGEIAG